MRWSEDQYRAYVTRGQPAPISEKAFMSAVLKIARDAGFLAYHTWLSKRSPEGFPDLILAPGPTYLHTPRLGYAVELKTDTGQVTPAQSAWLTALASCTRLSAGVWRPRNLEAIYALLHGQEPPHG